MKNKSVKSKIITGAIVASMLMSTSATVFAADSTSTVNNTPVTQHQGRHNEFQTKLDSLVAAGTLTSEGATAIKEALKPQDMNKDEKADKFRNPEDRENHVNMLKTKLDALVADGTLTADEQAALETAFTNADGNFKTIFDNLVANGTLTSDRATAIKEALKPQDMNKDEKADKFRNPKDRENHANMLKTKLDSLVAAGTLTTDEETAVINAFTPSK